MKLWIWLLVFFYSEHPLPVVHALSSFIRFFYLITIFLISFGLFSFQDHQSLVSRPSLPKGGAIQDVPTSATSEAPKAEDSQDGDEAKDSLEGTSLTTSPPPALSKDLGLDKKRKRMQELLSSTTSTHKNVAREASSLEDEEELFDALDS
jgi:hypothetical protein